jgi:hypothetical protein
MKKCNKCEIDKDLSEFSPRSSTSDGYYNTCKVCRNIYNKIYRDNYSDDIKLKLKKYKIEYNKLDKIKKAKKIWAELNRDYHIEYRKKYREKRNSRDINRKLSDPLYNIKVGVTSLIKNSIKNRYKYTSYRKNSKTIDILGCSYDDFKYYIESKFESWMNWENKGKYNGEFNYGWDLDHIIPISSAKTEEDVIRLNHYTNFQPLCSKVNRDIKRNK